MSTGYTLLHLQQVNIFNKMPAIFSTNIVHRANGSQST